MINTGKYSIMTNAQQLLDHVKEKKKKKKQLKNKT